MSSPAKTKTGLGRFEGWGHLSPHSQTLKDPTGRDQKVVMQRELITLFKNLQRKHELVFCQNGGESFNHWHIYQPFKKALGAAGINPKKDSWKELRHTTASLMHRKGVPALVLKDQLRHSNIKTTVDFYIGADLAYQREQIETLKLKSGKIVGINRNQTPSKLLTPDPPIILRCFGGPCRDRTYDLLIKSPIPEESKK